MAEFENYKEVAFLLSKAVQGQLTEKEEETLGRWRQEFPENELLYRQVLTSEFIISKSKQWEQVDLVMAYLKIRQKCEHRSRRVRLFQVTAVAVSVLLLLVSGLFYFVLQDKDDRYPVGLMTENILPGNAKAELILADGERILLGGPDIRLRNSSIQVIELYMEEIRMKTFMASPATIDRKWYVVDATDMTLGRLASEVAKVLRGKNKAIFTPHIDTGDYVIVINAEKVKVTGKKLDQKVYYRHSEYVGGMKETTLREMLAKKPEKVVELAVKGMLPKGPLGNQMYTKLYVYAGPEHKHAAQKPEVLTF